MMHVEKVLVELLVAETESAPGLPFGGGSNKQGCQASAN